MRNLIFLFSFFLLFNSSVKSQIEKYEGEEFNFVFTDFEDMKSNRFRYLGKYEGEPYVMFIDKLKTYNWKTSVYRLKYNEKETLIEKVADAIIKLPPNRENMEFFISKGSLVHFMLDYKTVVANYYSLKTGEFEKKVEVFKSNTSKLPVKDFQIKFDESKEKISFSFITERVNSSNLWEDFSTLPEEFNTAVYGQVLSVSNLTESVKTFFIPLRFNDSGLSNDENYKIFKRKIFLNEDDIEVYITGVSWEGKYLERDGELFYHAFVYRYNNGEITNYNFLPGENEISDFNVFIGDNSENDEFYVCGYYSLPGETAHDGMFSLKVNPEKYDSTNCKIFPFTEEEVKNAVEFALGRKNVENQIEDRKVPSVTELSGNNNKLENSQVIIGLNNVTSITTTTTQNTSPNQTYNTTQTTSNYYLTGGYVHYWDKDFNYLRTDLIPVKQTGYKILIGAKKMTKSGKVALFYANHVENHKDVREDYALVGTYDNRLHFEMALIDENGVNFYKISEEQMSFRMDNAFIIDNSLFIPGYGNKNRSTIFRIDWKD